MGEIVNFIEALCNVIHFLEENIDVLFGKMNLPKRRFDVPPKSSDVLFHQIDFGKGNIDVRSRNIDDLGGNKRMLPALLSDLHANIGALRACLKHAQEHGAERFASLGDLVGYGAEPRAVAELAAEHARPGAIVIQVSGVN